MHLAYKSRTRPPSTAGERSKATWAGAATKSTLRVAQCRVGLVIQEDPKETKSGAGLVRGESAKSPVAEVSHHCHRGSDKEPLSITGQS
jgi:hypothetical protein